MGSELLPFTPSDTFRQISFSDLNSLVRKYFNVQQAFIDSVHGGVPTFVIFKDQNIKVGFSKLNSSLDAYSLVPLLREGEEKTQCVLRIFGVRKDLEGGSKKKRRVSVQVILLLATIITVTISGILIAQEFFGEIGQAASLPLLLLVGGEYAASLMAILVVHELGHVIATKLHLIKSSLPYFVPAPPILGPGLTTPGTFGAVILQNTSAVNRDQLFDLGIAGPLSGFIVAIIVTFMGISLSVPIKATGGIGTFPPPLFYMIIALFPGIFPPGFAIALHPVALAGYIGLIITCLNLFPVSQLDGGHTSRAAFGASGYAKASAISIVALLILGLLSPTIFLPFALLVIFFSFLGGGGHPGPLDDVSKITTSRKILLVVGFIVLFLSLPMDYLAIFQYLP
jgi:membrane-associated protease RseP (regulator of RpoE activity)